MRIPSSFEGENRPATHIHVGGTFASAEPYIVRTILGSCVAVCLRDPVSKVGGMNHFMLPRKLGLHGNASSYGVHAMEILINQCMALGAVRGRLEAKVFGGGHVLKVEQTSMNVPQANIAFALEFLFNEEIPIRKMDVGGFAGREVFFFTDSGKTLVRKMEETGIDRSEIGKFEIEANCSYRESEADKNVTLFGRSGNEASTHTHRG